MVTYPNWTELFSGFDEVGSALGSFITNLVVGLLPAIIVIAIIGVILVAIAAVSMWIAGSLRKFGK